jgi:hypothetical protein
LSDLLICVIRFEYSQSARLTESERLLRTVTVFEHRNITGQHRYPCNPRISTLRFPRRVDRGFYRCVFLPAHVDPLYAVDQIAKHGLQPENGAEFGRQGV